MHDINPQVLGKFSCLVLVLGLELVSHPAGPTQAPPFSQGIASPSFATPLGLEGPVRIRAEVRNVGLSGVTNVRDELRWVF